MGAARHPNHREPSSLPAELRRAAVPNAVRRWIARASGSTVGSVRRLQGASSTAVHRIGLADGRRVVLRRYVWPGFLAEEPDAPGREVDALRLAARHGLPAPAVLAADPTGSDVGDGIPAMLMTYLPGRALAAPDPDRLAAAAAALHRVDAGDLGHDYAPWRELVCAPPPVASERPALWERAVERWHDAMPAYRPSLIHRDFHPGNVLWSRGRLTGVVDWANACQGPAGCDVATCWVNLLGWAREPAADAFVTAYQAVTGEDVHPFWLLTSLLERDRRSMTAAALAVLEPRVEALLARL